MWMRCMGRAFGGGRMYSTMLKFSVFKGDCLSDALIHQANATI